MNIYFTINILFLLEFRLSFLLLLGLLFFFSRDWNVQTTRDFVDGNISNNAIIRFKKYMRDVIQEYIKRNINYIIIKMFNN